MVLGETWALALLHEERKRRLLAQKNTVKLKASSFNDHQVKSERFFTEKPSNLTARNFSEGGGRKTRFLWILSGATWIYMDPSMSNIQHAQKSATKAQTRERKVPPPPFFIEKKRKKGIICYVNSCFHGLFIVHLAVLHLNILSMSIPLFQWKKGVPLWKKQQKTGWKERDKGTRGGEKYGRGCPKGEYVGGG